MNEILTFLSVYDPMIVLFIGMAFCFGIVKIIESIKEAWKKRQDFKEQGIQEGIAKERKHEARERQQEEEDRRICTLEKTCADLLTIVKAQQDSINLLIQSDELDIKAWIKLQHEKWIALGCIDSQSLDLVLQRYEIYAKEGGNSWAEKLVNEIKALPTVTVIPVTRPE